MAATTSGQKQPSGETLLADAGNSNPEELIMPINAFLKKLNDAPESVTFNDTMAVIDAAYDFTPARFTNGAVVNEAGQNSGSCKLFAFAKLNQLSEQQTLACFGAYYREDVLGNPDGSDHQNIRNFMKSGWSGVKFDSMPLQPKQGTAA